MRVVLNTLSLYSLLNRDLLYLLAMAKYEGRSFLEALYDDKHSRVIIIFDKPSDPNFRPLPIPILSDNLEVTTRKMKALGSVVGEGISLAVYTGYLPSLQSTQSMV